MRLTVERDGKRATIDVASDLESVGIDGRAYPVKVVSVTATRVELEIDGERILVEGWPEGFGEPPGPVDVAGERWNVRIEREVGPPGITRPPVTRPGPTGEVPATSPPAGHGIEVVPPMPGKVVDVRVQEGDLVHKGDVLLRIEAMKMINEIASPADGRVRDLRVAPGANVRARQPMLWIDPAGSAEARR